MRVPNNQFCLALARVFGAPYTATSANTSGEVPERSLEAILAQLGERAKDIDMLVDVGELPRSLPSTVVDARGAHLIMVREGSILQKEIFEQALVLLG